MFLLKERRRAIRVDCTVNISLVMRRGRNGDVVSVPSAGRIIDVSLTGAGLSVDQIRVDRVHLFYTPQDNPSYVLHLEVGMPPEDKSGLGFISIPVKPIRFDRIFEEDGAPKPFHVGVEFLVGSTDEQVCALFNLVGNKAECKKGRWWKKVFKTFSPSSFDK